MKRKIYNQIILKMSKIHKKTGSVCMICDEPYERSIMFHKTKRQTHTLCLECGTGYLKPILRMACNNVRKNIRNGVDNIKCPGSYHSASRNQCRHIIKLSNIKIPDCDISMDIFRLVYTLSSPHIYMCPDEKCGQVVDVDPGFHGNMLRCQGGCEITWCRMCLVQPFHSGKSCIEYEAENKNTENGNFIWEMNKRGKLKFCPQCKAATFKNNGCNKMICSLCGVKWCWLCTSTGIDYDHYNSGNIGRCSGKLWEGVDENGNAIPNNQE